MRVREQHARITPPRNGRGRADPAAGRKPGVVPDAAQIPLDEFTAYGDAASVRQQLQRCDGVVDVTMVAVPPGVAWPQIEATLRAAAPG